MPAALFILVSLLCLCPALATFGGAVLENSVPLFVSAGLAVCALKMPDGERKLLAAVLPLSFAIAAAAPAAFMIVQMLPLPFLANPVWTSVSPGFSQDLAGRISVDIGATATVLARYFSLVGAGVLSAAVATDRFRAGIVLSAAVAAIVVISLASLWSGLTALPFSINRSEALDCACLGVTLSAASAIRALERYETRRVRPKQSNVKSVFGAPACFAAFLICGSAIAEARSTSLNFAAAAGFLTFGAAAAVRRLNLGWFAVAAFGIVAVTITAALAAVAAKGPDPRLAFSQSESAAELSQRMLGDSPILGAGAGTFSALVPIYRPSGGGPQESEAATPAAQLSIEMGRGAFWLAIIAAFYAVYVLLRGAASRGRDYFYAAGAAACILTAIILAFMNTGIAGQAFSLLTTILWGLGIAQSKSRVQT